jgi:nucleotide-binding universal stress UspA family protein
VRPDKDAGPNLEPPVEELIMRCSLPVLLAPRSEAALQARRIVVGWSDTREASRAISDAMPLLIAAERVIVVAVGEGDASDSQQAGLDEVCRRLRHRGCNVTGERHAKGAKSVAADLAASAEGHGADLIVIGGYAHSRIQEWVLGGVTRDLIADCPTYVLFSH